MEKSKESLLTDSLLKKTQFGLRCLTANRLMLGTFWPLDACTMDHKVTLEEEEERIVHLLLHPR